MSGISLIDLHENDWIKTRNAVENTSTHNVCLSGLPGLVEAVKV